MKKRLLTLCLSIILLVSFMPATAFADEGWYLSFVVTNNYDDADDSLKVKKGRNITIKYRVKDSSNRVITDYTGFTFEWRKITTGSDGEDQYGEPVPTKTPNLTLKNVQTEQRWVIVATGPDGRIEDLNEWTIKPLDHMWFLGDADAEDAPERYFRKGNDETIRASVFWNFGENRPVRDLKGFSYQWYKYSSGKWVRIAGATKLKYTIKDIRKDSKWKIVAKDQYGDSNYMIFSIYPGESYKYRLASSKRISGFKAKKTGSSRVRLSWNKVSGINGYELYRATKSKGKYKKIATLKKAGRINYTDKRVKKGKKYYYKIRTYKYLKNNKRRTIKVTGKWSRVNSSGIKPKPVKLAKVRSVKASKIKKYSFYLKWKKVKGAKGYQIYYYDKKKKKYVRDCISSKNGASIVGFSFTVLPGKTYKLKVRAIRGTKKGPFSKVITVKTVPNRKHKGTFDVMKGSKLKLVKEDTYNLKFGNDILKGIKIWNFGKDKDHGNFYISGEDSKEGTFEYNFDKKSNWLYIAYRNEKLFNKYVFLDYPVYTEYGTGDAFSINIKNKDVKMYWTLDGTPPKRGQKDLTGYSDYCVLDENINEDNYNTPSFVKSMIEKYEIKDGFHAKTKLRGTATKGKTNIWTEPHGTKIKNCWISIYYKDQLVFAELERQL